MARETAGQPPVVDMNNKKTIQQVEIFGRLAATQQEMADWFGCSIRTIERYMANEEGKFCRVYKKALSDTKQSLRRMQLKAADSGNATVLIWLGKQLLQQKDQQVNINQNFDRTIQFAEADFSNED